MGGQLPPESLDNFVRNEWTDSSGIGGQFGAEFAPKHGSWLNVAEIELNVLIRQCLARRIDSAEEVQAEVSAWQNHRDNLQAKVNWQFTTEDARVKLRRLYPTFVV